MNHFVNLPPTKMGAALNIPNRYAGFGKSKSEYDRASDIYQAVYKETSDGEGYLFEGDYNPEIDYGDERIILPVNSLFEDYELWTSGTVFANVLGSWGDPIPQGAASWKKLYELHGITWQPYEEPDGFYDCFNIHQNHGGHDSYFCNHNSTIGGHVIPGAIPRHLNEGDNNLYIVPICSTHNTRNVPHDRPNQTAGNGNGFCMKIKLGGPFQVIRLKSYFSRNHVDRYRQRDI